MFPSPFNLFSQPREPAVAHPPTYKARRPWPPDLSSLSPRDQYRLERRYKRRAKLKWQRPAWNKWVAGVQWGAIGVTVVYCVYFMDVDERTDKVFTPIRKWTKELMGSFWEPAQKPFSAVEKFKDEKGKKE